MRREYILLRTDGHARAIGERCNFGVGRHIIGPDMRGETERRRTPRFVDGDVDGQEGRVIGAFEGAKVTGGIDHGDGGPARRLP